MKGQIRGNTNTLKWICSDILLLNLLFQCLKLSEKFYSRLCFPTIHHVIIRKAVIVHKGKTKNQNEPIL